MFDSTALNGRRRTDCTVTGELKLPPSSRIDNSYLSKVPSPNDSGSSHVTFIVASLRWPATLRTASSTGAGVVTPGASFSSPAPAAFTADNDTAYSVPFVRPVIAHVRATRSHCELVTAGPDEACTFKRYPRIAEPPSKAGGKYPTVTIASPPDIEVIFGALGTSATMVMTRVIGFAADTDASPT